MTAPDSFHAWLRDRIQGTLSGSRPHSPVIFWCDPQREWKQLLRLTATGSAFELWDDEVHELVLRDRLHRSAPKPRVVWLPVSRNGLEFCEVFALQAADVCELRLAKALDEYGVDLPNDDLRELQPLLASYVEERFDYPQASWKDLTLAHAESTLVGATTILEYLAEPDRDFTTLDRQSQFALFARIASRDFGLPLPALTAVDAWRAQAVAALLCTEAAMRIPDAPSVDDVLNQASEPLNAKALGRLVFVFGAELDSDGHDGRLKIAGSGYHLDRYAKVVRKLRSAGYPLILVVTDHGFFHWRTEKDEVQQKPAGELQWVSRRAVVGQGLRSGSDLHLRVTGSDLECMVPRNVNAYQTYGGLGYFHGGATLQELVIPVVTIAWPRKSQPIAAVLKPVERIERMLQKIEVAPGSVQQELGGGVDDTHVSRSVLVKAVDPATGKTLFKSKPATLEPGGGTVAMTLEKVPGAHAKFGTELNLQLLDADDDQLLESTSVRLSVEMDDWD